MSDDIMFCGLGPVPKGKVRAPPEYCLQKKQVRYYGKVAIDSELLEQYSKKETSLFKEQMKLKKIEDQAKKLIREFTNQTSPEKNGCYIETTRQTYQTFEGTKRYGD